VLTGAAARQILFSATVSWGGGGGLMAWLILMTFGSQDHSPLFEKISPQTPLPSNRRKTPKMCTTCQILRFLELLVEMRL